MPAHPPALSELLAIARESLVQLSPQLAMEARFELRVVVHALEIALRELEQGVAASDIERAALRELLGHDAELAQLNRELCERIAQAAIAHDDAHFLERMRACVLARLAIDNPRFEPPPNTPSHANLHRDEP